MSLGSVAAVDTIMIRGIHEVGVHGVLAEERTRPQPFRVDLDLEVDLAPPGVSDELADTVDYGVMAEAAARIVREESYQLLERLAQRLAQSCLADARVTRVWVSIAKLRPPIGVNVGEVGVRISRGR